MPVARVIEISSTSSEGFEAAILTGVARASKTLRNLRSAWVKEQEVEITNGHVTAYKVNLLVTFILEDEAESVGTDLEGVSTSSYFGG